MCGIAGAVGRSDRPDPRLVDAVLGAMEHRGPDAGADRWHDGTWLGFRRLSILDLAQRADQPMVDDATQVGIVFNGEIYNYVELREELAGLGHAFTTTGDTEVLLRAYLEWGTGVFERCDGMFALAIHDPRRNGVILARDRFGEKPLHLGRADDGAWWFASELATLRAAGVGTGRVDRSRVLGFLLLGDIEHPLRSYAEGVEQLPPGSWAELTDRGLGAVHRWFRVDDLVTEATQRPPASDEEVLAALDASVRLRLRSDVQVGTSLSGGVDSSAVVASLRAADPTRQLHAFTASFPGHAIDEFDRASLVADRYDVTLHRVEPTVEGFVADLDLLVHRQGGPIESPTVYAQWCVMRAANETGVTVLLDGQGADETWGGYPKHAGFALLSPHLLQVARSVHTWRSLGSVPRPDVRQGAGLVVPEGLRPHALAALTRSRSRQLGAGLVDAAFDDPQGDGWRGSVLDRAAQADLGRVLLPRLLRYADRNSMAWSREVRLPYLSPALVELGLRSDWAAGLGQGWTKLALRRAVEDRVPAEVLWRREKTAYETPSASWLRTPEVQRILGEAVGHLHDGGVLASASLGSIDPWRAITLSRFMDRYGLQL